MAQERPIAVCPECGWVIPVGGRAELIGERCGRRIDGRRCQGVYTTAPRRKDWAECPTCVSEGEVSGRRCPTCQGVGWFYQLDRYGNPISN